MPVTSISLPHHVSGTRARSVTPLSDGHRFAVVTRGGAALCNAADGTRTRPVRVAPSRAHAVSHDGRWLVTLQHPADRGTVVITALDGRERLRPTGVHDDFNHIVAFVPGTHRLQMLFGDGSSSGHGFSIREYDLDAPAGRGPGDGGDVAIALAETERLEGDPILTMLHDPAGRRLFAMAGRSLLVRDLDGGEVRTLVGPPPGAEDEDIDEALPAVFAVSADGDRALAVETDPDAGDYLEEALLEPLGDRIPVHLSEVATGRCLLRASLPGGWGEVDAGRARAWLSLDRGGRRLLRVGGRNVRVYDLERMASRFRGEPRRPRQGDVLRTWLAPRRVSHAVFLPDGEHALAVCGHEMVVWHTGHDEPRATWSAPARIVAWGLSTGGFLAVSDSTGGVRLGRLEGYRASTPIDSRSNGWSPWPFDMTGDEG